VPSAPAATQVADACAGRQLRRAGEHRSVTGMLDSAAQQAAAGKPPRTCSTATLLPGHLICAPWNSCPAATACRRSAAGASRTCSRARTAGGAAAAADVAASASSSSAGAGSGAGTGSSSSSSSVAVPRLAALNHCGSMGMGGRVIAPPVMRRNAAPSGNTGAHAPSGPASTSCRHAQQHKRQRGMRATPAGAPGRCVCRSRLVEVRASQRDAVP
jgi:hypothetical protein